MTWAQERVRSSAADLHSLELLGPGTRRGMWVCEVARPALVLGSTQPDALVDREACATAGIDVARRRSGGGAVLVAPGEVLWIDLVVPADDPLWLDDVAAASHWVGDAWAGALGALGVAAEVHRGPLARTAWSERVCFAAVGPGEVTASGRKVVGVSQRRTRAGARFQCAALLAWDPETLLGCLALDPPERAAGLEVLSAAATGTALDAAALVASLRDHLP